MRSIEDRVEELEVRMSTLEKHLDSSGSGFREDPGCPPPPPPPPVPPSPPGSEVTISFLSKDSDQSLSISGDALSLADVESSHVARIASAFANESRIDLVKAMWNGPVEAQTLSAAANLRGGQLYFHINELSQAGLLIKVGKLYCLSVLGRHIASVLLLIGSKSQGGALVEHPIE